MKKIFFLLLVIISGEISAQVTDSLKTSNSPKEILVNPEVLPEYPGGTQALYTFLAKNIKYPKTAKKNNVEGTVYVKFVVDEDGSVINPVIVRGIGAGCDEEVIRVIKKMPKWKPGEINGKKIAVYYTLPCKFSLNK
ncbi:MAG: energy transducer TonB [Bacteroidetes bacterium]|nr:energy transducer TonB [Bacteroidota bacterium]